MGFTIIGQGAKDGRLACPCMPDCPNRSAECKLTCETFQQYDAKRLEIDEKLKAELPAKTAIRDYQMESIRRSREMARRRK